MKLKGGYVLINLLAMLAMVILLGVAISYCIDIYTHHGESIEVPQLKGMNIDNARDVADGLDLKIIVSDSGYNKKLPAGQILEQSPVNGNLVKSGHSIYVTVNSGAAAKVQIPDIIDNSSYRGAEAELSALGFKLGEAMRVHGEKEWVYGIVCNGRNVYFGDYVPVDATLRLQIGDGLLNEALDNVKLDETVIVEEEDEFDDFSEIKE